MGRKKKSISRKFYWLEHPDQSGHFQLCDPNVPHCDGGPHYLHANPCDQRVKDQSGFASIGIKGQKTLYILPICWFEFRNFRITRTTLLSMEILKQPLNVVISAILRLIGFLNSTKLLTCGSRTHVLDHTPPNTLLLVKRCDLQSYLCHPLHYQVQAR